MTSKEINKLIAKYLKGEATLREIKLLNALDAFAKSKTPAATSISNASEKKDLQAKIFGNIQKEIASKKSKSIENAYHIAAVFLLSLGLVTFFILNSNTTNLVTNTTAAALTHVLPDGSTIILNQGSSFSYDSKFNKKVRAITLIKGEAYFKVSKNKQKPFIVKTNKLRTKVLGTQFNIKKQGTSVEVTVSEGLVQVYDDKKKVYLRKNEQAYYTTNQNYLFAKKVNAQLFDFWTKNEIILNDITLHDFAIILEKMYKVKLQFSKASLTEQKLSISIQKNESINKIVDRINLIGEVQLILKPNHMIEVKK